MLAFIARSVTFCAEPPVLARPLDNDLEVVASQEGLDGLDELRADNLPKKHDGHTEDKPRIRLRGRIDTDFIWSSQSADNEATFGELADTIGLRRARVGVEGHLTPDSHYIAEIDLASGKLVLRDLFAGWGVLHEWGELRAGHYREPFSLEGAASANSFAFLERSSINQLDPARNWGLGYYRCGSDEDWTFGTGVFQSGTDASDLQGGEGSDTAVTARGTMLPWSESGGTRMIHLGVALSSRIPDRGVVVINQSANSSLLEFGDSSTSPFVPTIRIPASFEQLLNAQWAFVDGPFSLQAEWYGTVIDQTGGPPVFYHGSYLSAGYFLTGEHRTYHRQSGAFGAVTVARPVLPELSSKPNDSLRGYGAWEVTGRVGYLDFFDEDTPRGPEGQLLGLRMAQTTCGVNWYLADRMRILSNYSLLVPDEPNSGSSVAHLFSLRLGLFW